MKFIHSIRSKIWFCVNIAFLGFLIATAFTFSANFQLSANFSHLRDVDFPLGFKAGELLYLYRQQQEYYQDGYLTGDLEAVSKGNELGRDILQDIRELQEFDRQKVHEHHAEADLFKRLEKKYRVFLEQASWLYASLANGDEPTLHLADIRLTGQQQKELLNDIEAARNFIEGAIIEETTQYQRFARSNSTFQISLFLSVLLLASIIVNLTAQRMLLSPLDQIRQMVSDYGNRLGGRKTLPVLESESEFGLLARTFRTMTLDLDRTTVSKAYVDNILSHMLDVLVVLDPGMTIVKVNQATLNLLGYSEKELLGRSVNEIVSGHLLNSLNGSDRAAVKKQHGSLLVNVEKDLIARDGRWIPVILSLSVLYEDDGTANGMVCVARDIAELKESRNQLEQSYQFLENVFESIPHPFFVVDATSHQVSFANSTARRNAREGAVFCHQLLHNHPSSCQHFHESCPLTQVVEKNMPATVEHRVGNKVYEIHGYPIFSASGEVAQMIEYAVDITDRKSAELELENFAQRLQESNQELQAFASVASHDLQEPLRKVITFGERLQSKYAEQLDERGTDYLWRMQNAALRMQTLINDLLDFSRITTTAQAFSRVSLNTIAGEVLDDLEARIEELQGTVICGPLPDIEGDALQIRQLLQNLLGNALKFHRPGVPPVIHLSGAIEPDPTGDGDFCRISVLDNGIGIESQYVERIFGVFQRLHSRSEYEGSGIGLAICRKIVLRHHGTIEVYGALGQGTEFVVRLPAVHMERASLTVSPLSLDDSFDRKFFASDMSKGA